jgi:hypothetical protein
MDRLLADHAEYVAFVTEETDPLADEHLRVPATDRRDVHEALVVDVLHDHADLVDVAIEHDGDGTGAVDLGHAVAGDVGRDLVGEGLGFGPPDARRDRLVPGRGGRVEETLEEGDG